MLDFAVPVCWDLFGETPCWLAALLITLIITKIENCSQFSSHDCRVTLVLGREQAKQKLTSSWYLTQVEVVTRASRGSSRVYTVHLYKCTAHLYNCTAECLFHKTDDNIDNNVLVSMIPREPPRLPLSPWPRLKEIMSLSIIARLLTPLHSTV